MSKKAWIIFAAICVALLAGLVYVSSKDKIDVSSVDTAKVLPASEQSGNIADQVFGKADSKVVFIEYGDFQCPGCGSAHPTIKRVTEKYKNQIAFVFRNSPLSAKHPNARAAAATSEAAGLQGKYWEMHNKLYESQASWQNLNPDERTDFFISAAKDLGLNLDTFKVDLASTKVNQKISYDEALRKKDNVDATPTFLLDGKKLTDIYDGAGAVDAAKLDAAIAKQLKDKGIALPIAQE